MSLLAAVLAAWLIGGCAFTGFGLLLWCLDGFRPTQAGDYFDAFWLGWAASLTVLLVAHIWFPINSWIAVGIGLFGVLGLVFHLRTLKMAHRARRQHMLAAGGLLAGAAWLALMGLRPLELYDAGLYHLQAIEWAGQYPSVPGLGNLHGRLAFNNSFFLFVALLGQGSLVGEGYRAAAGLLILAFLGQVAVSVARVVGPRAAAPADWLLTLLAMPALATVGDAGLATTSTDLPTFPLQVLMAYHLMRWLDSDDASRGCGHLVQVAVLGVAATTIKLSAAGFGAICAVLVLLVLMRERGVHRYVPPPATAALGLLMFAAMLVNGIVLSGYPFFPSTVLPMPVDWRMSEAAAGLEVFRITLFARQPGALAGRSLDGFAWFTEWLAANSAVLVPPTLAVGLGALVVANVWINGSERSRRLCVLVAPVWIAIAIWFVTAPAYRFAGALFWLAGAVPVAALRASGPGSTLAIAAFVGVAILPPQAEQLSLVLRLPVATLRRGVTSVPVVPMSTFVTDSGLRLFVPVGTEQAWAGPIPSTPYPDRQLRLRCPDDLACGFVLDGDR